MQRLTAPNPGPLTAEGTNTFIVGEGDVLIIDPGPKDPTHLELDHLKSIRSKLIKAVKENALPDTIENERKETLVAGSMVLEDRRVRCHKSCWQESDCHQGKKRLCSAYHYCR